MKDDPGLGGLGSLTKGKMITRTDRKMKDWSEDLIIAKSALFKAETDMGLGRDAPTMAIAINALLRCERAYNESRPKVGKA